MSIAWGTAVGSSTGGQFKLGVECRQTPTTLEYDTSAVRIYYDIYIWTKWSVSDVSNTFTVSGGITYSGAVTVNTTSNSSWSTSNIKLIKTVYKSVVPGTSPVSLSITAKLKGLEAVGTSYEATISKTYTVSALPPAPATDVRPTMFYVRANQVPLDYVRYSALSAWTHIASVSASSPTTAFATLNDECYFTTAYNSLRKFNGSSVSAVTASGTTTGAHLIEYKRRLFSAGDPTYSSALYVSDLDKPYNWTDGETMYLAGKDSGGNCTGLAVWSDIIWYFSESAIYALNTTGTTDNWESKCLSKTHGCVAPRTLAAAPNGVIFLSSDGVRCYGAMENIYSDDGSGLLMMSAHINPSLMEYTDAEKAAAVGSYYRNRYWISIGGDVYVCSLDKRTKDDQPPWTKYSNFDINCFATTRGDEYGLYAGSASTGTIWQLDTGGTDNGSAIPIVYVTPPIAAKSFATVKHFRHTFIAAESPSEQEITVAVETDDIPSPAQTVTLDANSDVRPKRLVTPARGRAAKVRLESDGLDQPITISEITMTYNPKPRVR